MFLYVWRVYSTKGHPCINLYIANLRSSNISNLFFIVFCVFTAIQPLLQPFFCIERYIRDVHFNLILFKDYNRSCFQIGYKFINLFKGITIILLLLWYLPNIRYSILICVIVICNSCIWHSVTAICSFRIQAFTIGYL